MIRGLNFGFLLLAAPVLFAGTTYAPKSVTTTTVTEGQQAPKVVTITKKVSATPTPIKGNAAGPGMPEAGNIGGMNPAPINPETSIAPPPQNNQSPAGPPSNVPPTGVVPLPKAKPGQPEQITSEALLKYKPEELLTGIIEDYVYTSQDKRDPFLPYEVRAGGDVSGPIFELQKFDLDQLKLTGIIWNVRDPKAMILDPTGKSHIVRVNEKVGRNTGYIARIRDGEIVIVESFLGGDGKSIYQTKVLKLSSE